MNVPDDRRYTEAHEWALAEDGSRVRIGITDYAQDALGDVVFVQLPDVGREVAASDGLAEVESTKSVSDIYAPIAGTVVEINEELIDQPDLVNQEPYGRGWFFVLEIEGEPDLSALLDAAGYVKLTES